MYCCQIKNLFKQNLFTLQITMKAFIFIFLMAIATIHAMKPSFEELVLKNEELETNLTSSHKENYKLQEELYKLQEETENKLTTLQQELYATKSNNL